MPRKLCIRCGEPVKRSSQQFCSRLCSRRYRVKSIEAQIDKSGGPNACWPWIGYIEPYGYGRVVIAGKRYLAHRAAYEHFVGPILPGFDLLHSCDNPPCCNPKHLTPGMHIHNMREMAQRGRAKPPHGEKAASAKLTAASVPLIRRRLSNGETCAAIAKDYGVSLHAIFDIKRGKTWKQRAA
jgi:hypothetical protein